jgi:hypothetical protein
MLVEGTVGIPEEHRSRVVYHFSHLDNLAAILEHGLLSRNEMIRRGLQHTDIAYSEIQERRSDMRVTCGKGGTIHDYVPLYFCKRSPMLYANVYNKIADEQFIIYFEFPIDIMLNHHFVITDSSANAAQPPNFCDNPQDLTKINWEAVETWQWAAKYDKLGEIPVKQAKMAELLIFERLDTNKSNRIIVWNESIDKIIRRAYDEHKSVSPPIVIGDTTFYFINNGLPPVTGPYWIKRKYTDTVSSIIQVINESRDPKFKNLPELLKALKADMHALPETSELVGLASENVVHQDDIATHSVSVARNLVGLAEYLQMGPTDKLLSELASFLHDIGKGPKSRWPGGKQKIDPDHPMKALPMLQRILTEDVGGLSETSVKILCKLVCYHDLVGDIIGKGRRVEELQKIVETEAELNMLIAIAKADIMALSPGWLVDSKIEQLRQRITGNLQNTQK